MTRLSFLAAAILATILALVFGLWLGGGSRRVGEGTVFREPYSDEPDFV